MSVIALHRVLQALEETSINCAYCTVHYNTKPIKGEPSTVCVHMTTAIEALKQLVYPTPPPG